MSARIFPAGQNAKRGFPGPRTFLTLDDVSGVYGGNAGKVAMVNPGETGLIFGSNATGTGTTDRICRFTNNVGGFGDSRLLQLSNGIALDNPAAGAEGYFSLTDGGFEKIWLSKEATTNDFKIDLSGLTNTPFRIQAADGNILIKNSVGISLQAFTSAEIKTEFTVINTLALSNLRGVTNWSCVNSDYGARLNLMKSRGTPTAPLILQTGDVIGRLIWKAFDGVDFLDAGCIRLEAVGTVALNRTPSDMVFYTASDTGPSAYRETLRLTANGDLIILDQKYFQTSRIRAVTSSDSAIEIQDVNGLAKMVFRFNPTGGYWNTDFYCGSVNNSGGFIAGTVFQIRNDTLGTVSCRVANDSTPQILYFDAKQYSFTAGATDGAKTTSFTILQTGVAIGTNATPTARLHLPAGTATASTAPLKFTSGPLLTAPEAGTIEFLTDGLYFTTTTGTTRKRIQLQGVIVKTSGSPLTLDESYTTLVTNTATAYTVNLPAATGSFKIYDIKNINTGLTTVDASGTETIDGALTQAVAQWDNLRIQDAAAGVWIIL